MTKTFSVAVKKVAKLPAEIQDEIGLDILDHLAALDEVRAKVREGIRSLERDGGVELDIKAFMKEIRRKHGRRS